VKKFSFRLQKVLDFREAMESLAKDAYLDSRAKRFGAEAVIIMIENRRKLLLAEPCKTIEAHQAMDALMVRLDDEVRGQQVVISVLTSEEEHAQKEWQRAKQDYEVLVKLREKALVAYQKQADAEEQKALDEWSVTRRAA
jgi:flagellar export protein FliJ